MFINLALHLAFFGPATGLIGLSFTTCKHPWLAVALLTFTMSSFGLCVAGFLTAAVSIAPQFSGIINAFITVGFQLGALTTPFVVGAITVHVRSVPLFYTATLKPFSIAAVYGCLKVRQ